MFPGSLEAWGLDIYSTSIPEYVYSEEDVMAT